MSVYLRSIRSIEPSQQYTPIARSSRFAEYSKPVFEQAPAISQQDWTHLYNDAVAGAVSWLAAAQRTQTVLEGMMNELGREWHNEGVVRSKLDRLVGLLNELEHSYRKHEEYLKPEVWAAVELALRHPATEMLGIKRTESVFALERAADELRLLTDKKELTNLLLGADGLLHDLSRALSYAEKRKAIDLLQLPFPAGYPYALYYGAMHTYWPMPLRGVILNKYI